eukprot:4311766-Amphidinium_carterae.1
MRCRLQEPIFAENLDEFDHAKEVVISLFEEYKALKYRAAFHTSAWNLQITVELLDAPCPADSCNVISHNLTLG